MATENDIEQLGPQLIILSAERTLLSWLRVSLGLMGLGFVLDRFGLFMHLQNVHSQFAWLPKQYSFWMGTGLVVAGALTSAAAGGIYARFRLDHARQGHYGPRGSATLCVLLSMLITFIGIVTAIFLIKVTD